MTKQIIVTLFLLSNILLAQIKEPQREIALIITDASENLSSQNVQELKNEITHTFSEKGVKIIDSVNYTKPQEHCFTFRVDLSEKTGKISVTSIGTTGLYTVQALYPEETFKYDSVNDVVENVNRYIKTNLRL